MNELNLYDLFEQIISKSKTMKRFIIAPGYGNELNKNNLGEILSDIIGGIKDGKKYPVCIMMPPVELIENYDKGWSKFKCRVFFLDTPNNDSNGIANINKSNNLSKHGIKQVWKDMRGCAIDFRKVFQIVTENNLLSGIRDGQSMDVIDRVSNVANDKSAGVGISFDIDLFLGCEVSDYTDAGISSIVINRTDLHPQHEH